MGATVTGTVGAAVVDGGVVGMPVATGAVVAVVPGTVVAGFTVGAVGFTVIAVGAVVIAVAGTVVAGSTDALDGPVESTTAVVVGTATAVTGVAGRGARIGSGMRLGAATVGIPGAVVAGATNDVVVANPGVAGSAAGVLVAAGRLATAIAPVKPSTAVAAIPLAANRLPAAACLRRGRCWRSRRVAMRSARLRPGSASETIECLLSASGGAPGREPSLVYRLAHCRP